MKELGKNGDPFKWAGCAGGACGGRRFFKTKKGYFGLGPRYMKDEDVIVVLFGGITPYVLRKMGEHYAIVGECYVHGLMNGEGMEMLERKELESKRFPIR